MTSSNQHQDYTHSLSVNSLTVREPIKIAQGATEWKDFTPVMSAAAVLGTGGTTRFQYRITGHTLHVVAYHSQTVAGTAGSGTYGVQLPTGCVPAVPLNSIVGQGSVSGNSKSCALLVFASTSSVGFQIVDPTNTGPALLLYGTTTDADYRFSATAMTFSFSFMIPLAVSSSILRA